MSDSILIVEDEFLIALDMEDALRMRGFDVVGPAATLADGMALAEADGVSAALLDVNLMDGTSRPIAEALRERAIPFAYVTGYGRLPLDEDFPEAPVISKPAGNDALDSVLAQLLADA